MTTIAEQTPREHPTSPAATAHAPASSATSHDSASPLAGEPVGAGEVSTPDSVATQFPEAAPSPHPKPVAATSQSAATSADPSASRFQVSSFTLKLAAIICMTTNHAAWTLGAYMPYWLLCATYALGGATFPIMAFMLVEGFRHTSNLRRYELRLLIWALIAAVPFYVFLVEPDSIAVGDVLFTLFMSLVLLDIRSRSKGPAFVLALLVVLGLSLFCDWGFIGPLMVLTFAATGAGPDNRSGILLTMLIPFAADAADIMYMIAMQATLLNCLPNILHCVVGYGIATLLLCAYNGTLGHALAKGSSANRINANTLVKWGFYAYYPLHITVLGLIAQAL